MKEYTIVYNVQITEILTMPDNIKLSLKDDNYLANTLKHDVNGNQRFDDVLVIGTKIFEMKK